jgi:hypothetical protein
MHLIECTQKYKTPVKLLHVSTPRCHHQGVILTEEYKASTPYIPLSELLPDDGTSVPKHVRDLYAFYTSVFILLSA